MKLTVLLILDGYGISEESKRNAIGGGSPYVNYLMRNYPSCKLRTDNVISGYDDGVPVSSQTGHLIIGVGHSLEKADYDFDYDAEFVDALGRRLAFEEVAQLRITEAVNAEKVTTYLDGGIRTDAAKIVVESVADVASHPEMSAYTVCERAVAEMDKDKYDVIVISLPNCQSVAETGNFSALTRAVSVVDDCVRIITENALRLNGRVVLTGSCAGAESMPERNKPFGGNTFNPVPFAVVDEQLRDRKISSGSLIDVAPTVLSLLELEIPAEMSGKALI